MSADQHSALTQLITDACAEMFTSAGFAVRVLDFDAPLPAHLYEIVGFIGFAGPLRGSLMISGSAQLFRSTHPGANDGSPVSKVDLFDWTAEMANQLLGRVKRRFLAQGRDFQASTPTAIEGRELTRRFPSRAGVVDLVLTAGGDPVSISFEVTPPAGEPLFLDNADPIAASAEGDLVLF